MGVQTFTTPAGERMVILSEAEYLAMQDVSDMAQDSAAIDRFEARLKAGAEELIPAGLVNAILGGGNPVRIWRGHRGLSGKALAERAGLSPAYLSQIETGKREGTLEAMRNIALALNITLDDLAG